MCVEHMRCIQQLHVNAEHLTLHPVAAVVLCAVCSTPIEYKYIIRAGDGEVKAVVQWQPCNNLELQVRFVFGF
jgi:bifunctional N-acetylglucosamine-1-phosphate-uridyltransferase/glucosamine-1-phosphate-acetyltransferase GlmU-like protein